MMNSTTVFKKHKNSKADDFEIYCDLKSALGKENT